jgi:hypothetical protein
MLPERQKYIPVWLFLVTCRIKRISQSDSTFNLSSPGLALVQPCLGMEENSKFICPNFERCKFKRILTGNKKNDSQSLRSHKKICDKKYNVEKKDDEPIELSDEIIPDRTFKAVIIYRWRNEDSWDLGLVAASLIYESMARQGIQIFQDIEGLQIGDDLRGTISKELETTKKVIMIITPGCFDRTMEPDDFFRWEITEAVRLRCTILPIVFYCHTMPSIPVFQDDDRNFPQLLERICTHRLCMFFDPEHKQSELAKIAECIQYIS